MVGGRFTTNSDGEGLADRLKPVRSFLADRPSVRQLLDSRTSTFETVHCVLPSNAVTDEEVELTASAWDEYERLVEPDVSFRCVATDPDATLPEVVAFDGRKSRTTERVTFETPGTHYVQLERRDTGETVTSNPVVVAEEPPEYGLYWGDLHFHSRFSDGVGSVEKGLSFARDVVGLDVAACTDHDTMGFFIPPSWQRRRMHEEYFGRIKDAGAEAHDPGEFVSLMAYEWTQQPNVGGHINVYFDTVEDAELFDSRMDGVETYEGLWDRLCDWKRETGHDVLTIPHHTAEAKYPFDFSGTEYDDGMAPLVEVHSRWGSSECPGEEGNPNPIRMGDGEVDEPGHYAQDALRLGHRVGLMASSDIHGPRPGRSNVHVPPHLPDPSTLLEDGLGWGLVWRLWNEPSYPGGLVAFYAPELTREAIFESLKRRRVYGTTQPARIVVSFSIDGTRLRDGDHRVQVSDPTTERQVSVSVAGTAPLTAVEVIKNNDVWRTYEGESTDPGSFDGYTMEAEYVDDAPVRGMDWDRRRGSDDDVYYVRVRQIDEGMAWAGPLWAGTGRT